MIYGDNSRGKTTLSAILRSLKLGDPKIILGRKTLDSIDSPYIKLQTDKQIIEFKAGLWSTNLPSIEVFDQTFISENVFSGDLVNPAHKQNLYRIVLGADGVVLADKVDKFEIDEISTQLALDKAKSKVEEIVPKGMKLEEFLSLELIEKVDEKLQQLQEDLRAQEEAEEIKSRPALTPLEIGYFNLDDFDKTLKMTVADISGQIEHRIREHIRSHFKINGLRQEFNPEKWIADGIEHGIGEKCPMCDQTLANSSIFDAIRDFFSDEYRKFQNDISKAVAVIRHFLSSDRLLSIQETANANLATSDFWSRYVPCGRYGLVFENDILPVFIRLRDVFEPLINAKLANPLEVVALTPEAIAAYNNLDRLLSNAGRMNYGIYDINTEIQKVKRRVGESTKSGILAIISNLEAHKLRHHPDTLVLIAEYEDLARKENSIQHSKKEAESELAKYNETTFSTYQHKVNEILQRFGAPFILGLVSVEYKDETPRVAYSLEIRGQDIELDCDHAQGGRPSFGNTLSTADRNTLALAFFIAQISKRQDISDLILVFDDPFNSFDSSRKHWTCHFIRGLTQKVKQVIVLSHLPDFLKSLGESSDGTRVKYLEVARDGTSNSCLVELDLDCVTAPQIEKDINLLKSFSRGEQQDTSGTIRAIRPILEYYIRSKVPPELCPPGKGWLGSFLGEIYAAGPGSPLSILKNQYDDLDVLNSYTSSYHHNSGECPLINSTELTTHVNITLRVIEKT